jgi:GTPase SAR1 family protein
METVINQDLQLAFDFVKYTNRNIFLTGKAGTGKTTFLHELKRTSPKRMVVLAPTGVAAINAGGVTIHSFFQLPLHPYVPSIYLTETPVKTSEQKENSGYKMSREKINIIKSLDLLVIDEISMVRADILDAIDASLRRYKNHYLPFGGVQLLMIGDLQQLAPVVKEDDMQILRDYYKVLYFFGSKALCSTDYVTIELKHIYRQNDQLFINLLNKVRENRIDQECLNELNKRYIADFDTDSDGGYITLTTHNFQSQSLNDAKLAQLPGKPQSFRAIIKDEFPEFSYPNVNELFLKPGAQVMFVKNDISKDKLFFNGKIGKVIRFEDDLIIVKCPGDNFEITVEPVEWQNVKYTLDDETKDIQETVIGTFTQFPLRLAWAITIHKSQGLTFDRAVIDARAAFAHGQVYVALSRCRTLEGLVLNSRISQNCIKDDPVISTFVTESEQNQPGTKELAEAKRIYQEKLLKELFDFTILTNKINYAIKVIREHQESIIGNPEGKLENALASIKTEVVEVSEKFRTQINRLSRGDIDAESNAPLQERVMKASVFFSERLEISLEGIMNGFSVETDNKAVRKSFREALERLKKETFTKLACLQSTKTGFRLGEYLDIRAKSSIEVPGSKTKPVKVNEDNSGIINHPELFNRLKEWRDLKNKELNLPHYMILHQKTMLTLANLLPQTMSSLRRIKGMGNKKSEHFGEELLDIIVSYCREEKIESAPDNIMEEEKEKKPKKEKGDTRKVSLALYREGNSVLQIAELRNLAVTTIEQHLSYFVENGEIQVSEFVSKETTDLIITHLNGSEDLKLGPVKEILGDKVTWSEIRFVASHIKHSRLLQQS